MAVTGKTARRLLKFLLTTDPPEIHAALEGLANQLDNDVEGGQGKLSERPAPSVRGRVWMVQGEVGSEAVNNGVLTWDTGATWVAVPNPAPTAQHFTGLTAGEEPALSPFRPATVVLSAHNATAELQRAEVQTGGTLTGYLSAPAGGDASLTFPVNAAGKFKIVKLSAGTQEYSAFLRIN